jgi:hypothetical protein
MAKQGKKKVTTIFINNTFNGMTGGTKMAPTTMLGQKKQPLLLQAEEKHGEGPPIKMWRIKELLTLGEAEICLRGYSLHNAANV